MMVLTRWMIGGMRPRLDVLDTGVDGRMGSIGFSPSTGRHTFLRDEDEAQAGTYSRGIDGSSQALRQENTFGDDETDNEDDTVEALYE